MSDAKSSAPRRSQREKKQVEKFGSQQNGKRKRGDAPDGEGQSETDYTEHIDEEPEEEEQEQESPIPRRRGRPLKAKTGDAPPAAKKPRKSKADGHTGPKRGRGRPRKVQGGDNTFDAEKVAGDAKIAGDNALFNTILNPSAALQSTAEDFLETLSQNPALAQSELINCVLRACGCNDSVDSDKVMDYDGVVDALDDFTEGLKKEQTHIYPLTSKLPIFKKFRKSLSEFIDRLVSSSAELGLLYTSDLMLTLQTWVIAMSSSQLRSFRHTATVIALEVETALCDVAAAVEKEAEVIGRQREGERKRKVSNKGSSGREKELDGKAAAVRERRSKLAEFLKEFVDGVFVHRYRDLDPLIRSECVHSMGLWFKKHPSHFLDGSYLRYVGWVLSDASTQVRLEAVRSLIMAYEQTEFIGSMHHFTDRFKPRLVEMAMGDTELPVRVAVIQVLEAIDGHGLLEEEQREELCLLVYDEEVKVRRAVSGFVKGVWQECVEERLVGRNQGEVGEEEKKKAGVKALGMLLVKWGKACDKLAKGGESVGDEEGDGSGSVTSGESSSKPVRVKEVASLLTSEANQKGRTSLAVEALWDEIEAVNDWETLLDVLLLDHSAADEDTTGRRNKKKTQGQESATVDEAWRLGEEEEGVLLEVLVAALREAKEEVSGLKKGEEDSVASDITRSLIKGLPRLFLKHQTDENRISQVLLIPQLMSLDMYLEMRMIMAYANLWDDVTKQFLSHSSLRVLSHAVSTMRHLLDATSLSNTNSTKILELEDELSSSLRDTIGEREELEVATFSEDEALALGAVCARLSVLAGTRDMTAWLEEDEGGKQSSAWDIIIALTDRGKLGYKIEESMIEHALQLLTVHVVWKAKGLTSAASLSPEEEKYKERLREQRDSLLERLLEFAVGTQSNVMENVKRAAFQNLINLHVLFCSTQTVDADGHSLPTAALALTVDDEVQYRCAGFVQAEIERYAEETGSSIPEKDDEHESDEEEQDEVERDPSNQPSIKMKSKKPSKIESKLAGRTILEKEYMFMSVVTTFLRAVRVGALHFRHGAVLLAHYGRLGSSFDLCSKIMVDILREEGMYNRHGEAVAGVIIQALQESFVLRLDGVVHTEEHSVALAKLLSSCFVIRGAQLAVLRRLESQHIVHIHTVLLTWIGKRLAAYENNKNTKGRDRAIHFFRVLLSVSSMIDSRDALTLKAHLDQVLAQAKVTTSATDKAWEPYRAYEKKLGATISKEKGTKGRKKHAKSFKNADLVSSDEETGDQGPLEKTNGVDLHAHPRPKPRPIRKRINRFDAAALSEAEASGSHNGEGDISDTSEAPMTVPSEPATRRSARKQQKQQGSPVPEQTSSRVSSPLSDLPADSPEDAMTSGQSRKRGRSAVDEDEDPDLPLESNGVNGQQDNSRPSSPAPTPPTPELQIKRKRIRH